MTAYSSTRTRRVPARRYAAFAGSVWAVLAPLSAPQSARAQTTGSHTDLPEVIVTAQKQSQTLEQVPASVSSVDGDFIRESGATNFAALQNYVANTSISLSASSGQFVIRGFGTVDSNPGFDPSVGAVVDGIYYDRSNYLSAFFSDIDRFEVLRGPQGTLFGKNCTAGLLNVVTAAPEHRWMERIELEMTDYGDRSFRPVFQAPIGRDFSVRVAGNYEYGNRGTVYNTDLQRPEGNPSQDTTRLRLRYDSHEHWTYDVGLFYSYQRQNFNIFQINKVQPAMAALDHNYDPAFNGVVDGLTSANVPANEQAAMEGISGTLDYDLTPGTGFRSLHFISISGLAEAVVTADDLDADFGPVPFIRDSLVGTSPERQFTQELRVSGVRDTLFGLGAGFNFVGGVYYSNSTLGVNNQYSVEDLGGAAAYMTAAEADLLNNPHFSGAKAGNAAAKIGENIDAVLAYLDALAGKPVIGAQSAITGLSQRSRSYASFGQFEYFFTRNWSLIGGLRFSLENKTGTASSSHEGLLIPLIAQQQDFNQPLSRTERDFSPKAGFKWTPSKHVSTYATWSRGYKSGGFNAMALSPEYLGFQPERATNYEAGIKARTRLLGGAARMSLSLFTTDFDNLQVSTYQSNAVIIRNAAAARSRGFEADLYWLPPLRGASLYLSAGLADAIYRSYTDAPVAAATGQSTQNLSGNRLPFAPRWTASFIPAYTVPLPELVRAEATLAVDILHQGDRYTNVDDDPNKLQPDTNVINTRLTFDSLARSWSLTLAANNLTGEVILDQVVDEPEAPGNLAAVRTDYGRYYSANLSYTF